MQFIRTPYYEDIFDEEKPNMEDLVKDVPSRVIISYLAYLNSCLHLNFELKDQVSLLKNMLKRQSFDTLQNILNKHQHFYKQQKEPEGISVLSSIYIKSFMHYELCHYRDFPFKDTTPQQELNIYKAYLLIVHEKNMEFSQTFIEEKKSNKGDFFPVHTWPMLLAQLEATIRQEPIPSLIRAVCFFNFLQYHSPYSQYVKQFIARTNHSTTWDYLFALMNILQLSWDKKETNTVPFALKANDSYRTFFELLCIDPDVYGKRYQNAPEDHLLMKSKPFLKSENQYIVLDWDLITNKLHEGLLFDFFENSGIKECEEINTIPKFKRFIGKEITEKFTFQRLLKGILDQNHSHLIFPEKDDAGEPDAYFRLGNKILLFEIKDSLFAGEVLISQSYQKIKGEIDKKLNNRKKGIGQLIRMLEKLDKKSLEGKPYSDLGIKPRNFIIYPILIYTDVHFSMDGVARYLVNEFKAGISHKALRENFKRIADPTILQLNFLISAFTNIKEFGFFKLIDSLHHEVEKREKRHRYKVELNNLLSCNENHEQIALEQFPDKEKENSDFDRLASVLNLTEGLPKN